MAAATADTSLTVTDSSKMSSATTAPLNNKTTTTNPGFRHHQEHSGWWWGRRRWDEYKQGDTNAPTAEFIGEGQLKSDNPAADPATPPQSWRRGPCRFQHRHPLEEIAEGQTNVPPEFAYYGPRGYDMHGPRCFWLRYFYCETAHLFNEFDF